MIIVGLSAFTHDSACCLVRDGKLIAAAQEERFSRLKHDGSLPSSSFRYCLKAAGVSIDDVDVIACAQEPWTRRERQSWSAGMCPDGGSAATAHVDREISEMIIRDRLGFEGEICYVGHHLCHAASAFYFSGWAQSAVLTVDGVGDWDTLTYGEGSNGHLSILEKVRFPHSLGLFYSTVTAYLGFIVNDGEYKVMGLAPYGRPLYADRLRQVISIPKGGQLRLDMRYFDFLGGKRMYSDQFVDLLGTPPVSGELTSFAANLAASAQVVLEEILLSSVRHLHNCVPCDALCMAGGVALNCVANSRLRREGPFKRMFVQPAADDSGCALGAAVVTYALRGNCRSINAELLDVYLGPSASREELDRLLFPMQDYVTDFGDEEERLLQEVAGRLASGQVVGWFHGRMEFGPRAMGHRSILADPRPPEMVERLNRVVKHREPFRPFAPSILRSVADEYFDIDGASPFMLFTFAVKQRADVAATTHIDGSARVQTVDEHSNGRYFRLLTRFYSLTGCPALLNTSFNLRDEPIVCSAADALATFLRSDLDCLVLEDFIVDRSRIPMNLLTELLRQHTPRVEFPQYNMYTL
jgi:carbamoyltransferase